MKTVIKMNEPERVCSHAMMKFLFDGNAFWIQLTFSSKLLTGVHAH